MEGLGGGRTEGKRHSGSGTSITTCACGHEQKRSFFGVFTYQYAGKRNQMCKIKDLLVNMYITLLVCTNF